MTDYFIGQTIPDWFFSSMAGKTGFSATATAGNQHAPDWLPGAGVKAPNWKPGASPVTEIVLTHYQHLHKTAVAEGIPEQPVGGDAAVTLIAPVVQLHE